MVCHSSRRAFNAAARPPIPSDPHGTGRAIITRDVIEDPRWTPWLWLAKEFDYRACWSFPVGTSAGKILGSFAMYYKEPREATQRDFDLAATLTRAALLIIMNGPHPAVQ
jgi:GAF domain-containing protein